MKTIDTDRIAHAQIAVDRAESAANKLLADDHTVDSLAEAAVLLHNLRQFAEATNRASAMENGPVRRDTYLLAAMRLIQAMGAQ